MNEYFNEIKCGNPDKLAAGVAFFDKEFPTIGDDIGELDDGDDGFAISVEVSSCLQTLYDSHFGFRAATPPQDIIKKGIELSRMFFEFVGERLVKSTPDMAGDDEIAWFEPYADALLLTLLDGSTKDRQTFSDWLHPDLVVETVAIPIEPALGDVLLCIAASFQSSPLDTTPLEERLQNSRKKRPKLLFKAWQALQSDDRETFVSALADSTLNFAKTTADDDRPLTAVAVLESILAGLANEHGWTDLSFDLPVAARMVTRHSIGLD